MILNFIQPPLLAAPEPQSAQTKKQTDPIEAPLPAISQRYKLRMRRLFDRWHPEAVIFLITLKLLQLARFFGIKADENGWRKASRVYLRKEHSKFCLAVFRLNCVEPEISSPTSLDEAKARLVARLASFIKDNAVFHWGIDWHRFSATRRHNRYVDIVETVFDNKGQLLQIIPHFDPGSNQFPRLTDEQRKILHKQVVRNYNESLNVRDKKRLRVLRKKLTNYITDMMPARSPRHHLAMRHYIKRILNATFIHFEVISNITGDELLKQRLKTPNFKRRKHPGGGLLNILCRFDFSLKECDLWFQYHHVPVDGMPMQEMLEKLKSEWGTAGPFHYPALTSAAARPEIFYFGNKIFRARIFCDFTNLLSLRKKLNKEYVEELGETVSFPCLLLWSLTQQACFRELKFSMPVDNAVLDANAQPEDRSITLLFVRPSNYYNPKRPFNGFADFVKAFNQNLYLTRMGQSESHQFLELCAVTHPLFYSFVRYFMKNALKEVVGTVGITVIRNAEMFVSPLTDLQLDGFMAFGNCRIPTTDGKFAGAVSICGSKEHIRRYVPALQEAIHNINDYIKLPE